MSGRRIRVGLVGVGNCASALVQGIGYYGAHPDAPGLMTRSVSGYRAGDIDVACAFDVSTAKVGFDVADAIFVAPNNTRRFYAPKPTGVAVLAGPRSDGIGEQLRDVIPLVLDDSEVPPLWDTVSYALRESKTDILINYLPVGSEEASRGYAIAAFRAGCSFLNCIPVFLANDPAFVSGAIRAGAILAGDDIKSQYGATIVHQRLAALLLERGIRLDRTYQLNVGGNTDFLNMLEQDRLISKRQSKTRAVVDAVGGDIAPRDVHIGPSDYVEWLEDRKVAFIRLEGSAFGGAPLSMEIRLEVWDSPNSAGVVIDAIRAIRAARAEGRVGLLPDQEPYFKAPGRPIASHGAAESAE